MRKHLVGREPFEDLALELLGLDHRFNKIDYRPTDIFFTNKIIFWHTAKNQCI